MMKIKSLLWVLVLIAFAACEKVINIDLNTVNPKLIVEANVTDQPGPYTVTLTHSVNYYDPDVFPAETGAHVTISDNAGNSEVLTEVSPGVYKTSTLMGVVNRTYALKIVTQKGDEYDATSTMPRSVPIDSVNFIPNRDSTSFRVVCRFPDPPYELNWYKLQLSSNDTAGLDTINIRIIADGFADGQELSLTYRTHFVIGDTAIVKLECIDKTTYDFYRTLPDVEGGVRPFISAPPANPVTNLTNGALGYFSAHSVTIDTAIVHY